MFKYNMENTELDIEEIEYEESLRNSKDYDIPNVGDMDNKFESKVPIDTLCEMIEYMEEIYNQLTSGDMPDSDGQCMKIDRYIKFLDNLEHLYHKCNGCNQIISIDEAFYIIDDGILFCSNCYRV